MVIICKLILSSFIDRILRYDYFGAFYNNTLVYLSNNPNRDVVKHKVDDLSSVPRHLPSTRIQTQHIGGEIIGVHVGHYFWIFGGRNWQSLGPLYGHEIQTKSSLWSLNRNVWINGPEIPKILIKDYPCATALNDTFAIIINIRSDWNVIPVQAYDFSKGDWHSMANPPIQKTNLVCTCATMYEKIYRQ